MKMGKVNAILSITGSGKGQANNVRYLPPPHKLKQCGQCGGKLRVTYPVLCTICIRINYMGERL